MACIPWSIRVAVRQLLERACVVRHYCSKKWHLGALRAPKTHKEAQLTKAKREHMSLEKNPTTGLVVELFGPTVEFLTSPKDERNDFCVLKRTIPPGGCVPLHSHSDTEDFVVVSGSVEGLRREKEGYEWIPAEGGDFIHISGGVQHAWRNLSDKPAISLIITTKRLGHFFQEVGRPAAHASQPIKPDDLARFAASSARYGYWNATPEENAAVGIHISF